MIANKKEFSTGLLLFIGFWIVFAIGMSPIFAGQNILNFMDSLYNSISKKSAYYIPQVKEKAAKYQGQQVSITVKASDDAQAKRFVSLFEAAQAKVAIEGKKVKVEGDLGLILTNVLNDADAMFANDGAALTTKYGYNERQVLYDWWQAMKAAEKDLYKHELNKEGLLVGQAQTKAIEAAYNYYGIKAEGIKAKMGIVVISLVGYVIYTLWFGFSILFMFEGWGLKLEH